MKFIYEFTSASYASNLNDFKNKGLLEPQQQYGGVPRMATEQIERLFEEVHKGADVEILKRELDRWGLFSHYENQFLDLFE
jgi:transposase